MIRLAIESDIIDCAKLLMEMYIEVFGTQAETDPKKYISQIVSHFNSSDVFVYIDNEYRGIAIVKELYDPLIPNAKRVEGTSIYVIPSARHTKVARSFYIKLFELYDDTYDILGYTEIGSNNIPMMDKRHTLVAKVYQLKRI